MLENIFELDGEPAHEIVFVLEGRFVDQSAYEIAEQTIRDDPTGRVRVRWRPCGRGACELVPGGIEQLIWP